MKEAGSRAAGRHAAQALGAAVALGISLLAGAPSALAAQKVYSPIVERGETEVELRSNRDFDSNRALNGNQVNALEIGHGFDSGWFSELEAEIVKQPGEHSEPKAFAWDNVVQLTEQGRYPWDWGLRFEYEKARDSDEPDEITVGPIAQSLFGRALVTANLFLEKTLGHNAESRIDSTFAGQVRWLVNPLAAPGVEYYAEDHSEKLGPALYGSVHLGRHALKYQLGLLFGLERADPNRTLRWQLEYEF